jgi:Sulfotransferase domain
MPLNSMTPRLIVLHLGRTGGTALRQELLYRCLDPQELYWTDGREPPARGGSVEELLALPRKEQEKLRVVAGHIPFGLREQLPWPESWQVVTFLRDPAARTISEYYQVRDSASNPAHADGWRYTLEEYVRRQCGLAWNGMCRMLSDECYGRTFDTPEAMYQAALRHANCCMFVGLTEYFDESVRRLCRLYGWRAPTVQPRHCLTPKGRTLTEGEQEAIRAATVYDQALYDHWREQFLREPVATPLTLLSLWERASGWLRSSQRRRQAA